MAMLKAEVKNGRLVMDEPSDLPEGTVLELVPATSRSGADMDSESRRQLSEILRQSHANAKAGEGRPAKELIAELRDRRSG